MKRYLIFSTDRITDKKNSFFFLFFFFKFIWQSIFFSSIECCYIYKFFAISVFYLSFLFDTFCLSVILLVVWLLACLACLPVYLAVCLLSCLPAMCMSISLRACLNVCPSICILLCAVSMCLSVSLCAYQMFLFLSIDFNKLVCLFTSQYACLNVFPSVYMLVCMCVCLSCPSVCILDSMPIAHLSFITSVILLGIHLCKTLCMSWKLIGNKWHYRISPTYMLCFFLLQDIILRHWMVINNDVEILEIIVYFCIHIIRLHINRYTKCRFFFTHFVACIMIN